MRDDVVLTDALFGRSVVEICPLPLDSTVQLGGHGALFATASTDPLYAGKGTLRPPFNLLLYESTWARLKTHHQR